MSRWLRYLLAGLLFTSAAFAQESRSSVSLNLTGAINKSSVSSSLDQSPTNSGGFLASYRFDFSRHGGVEINYGYTRNSQYFATSTASVQAGVHETTAAYVFKMPFGKITPFVTAGTGALIFNPTSSANNTSGSDTQARATFLYGGGVDYNISKKVAFRAQYRGLVYKAPDFGLSGVSTNAVTHTAEPSIGLVFHF